MQTPMENSSSYGSLSGRDASVYEEDIIEESAERKEPVNVSKWTSSLAWVGGACLVGIIVLLATTSVSQSLSSSRTNKVTANLLIQPSSSSSSADLLQEPTDVVEPSNVIQTDVAVTDTSRPNFIILVADDLGWNSIGYTDNELEFATPTLTKLAKSGLIMGNYYAQEVCSPSRAALLTGRYPLSAGMQYGMVAATAEWGLPLDEITLAEVLQDEGYKTHMLGKWHLGYFSPLFLPTARGFDDYIGYVNGENYYWSKRSPDYPEFVDFMESDKDCYRPYSGDDIHDYSTTFYTNKALSIIDEHSASDPLLLVVAYQAVHDPFVDTGKFANGMPDSYLDADTLKTIHTTIHGRQRQEYVKSLVLLDASVGQIVDKLEERGLMDNSYVIFMSDNGGCFHGGGKNGPLRGSKGSLFEGGIKVDSFIYSPMLKSSGTVYTGLMHVSDWFPTILALAGINYAPGMNWNSRALLYTTSTPSLTCAALFAFFKICR